MSITYNISFLLNLANALPAVESLENSVNTHLAAMGYEEKLTLRAPIKLTLTVARILNKKEVIMIKRIMTDQFNQSFIGSNPICKSFRRQSCNALPSVS